MIQQEVIDRIATSAKTLAGASTMLDEANAIIQSDHTIRAQMYLQMAIDELTQAIKEVGNVVEPTKEVKEELVPVEVPEHVPELQEPIAPPSEEKQAEPNVGEGQL